MRAAGKIAGSGRAAAIVGVAFCCCFWVAGAAWAEVPEGEHWAFEPVRFVPAPEDPSGWSANEVDRFIARRLREEGIEPGPRADRGTLIRRAYFDLIGLPPTPEAVDAFVRDESPDAFVRVVEQLLASEHYGERWGRHWLDLARYADTSGDGADAPVPEARLYRDYVIDSFNADLPYDQFILEQIAGDKLAARDEEYRARERIIATGYVALARRFNNRAYADMHLVIENTLSTIGQGMLGLTIGCARCHDHKFDAISVEDYYGLYGYFESTQYPHAGTEQGRQRQNFVPLPGGGIAYAVTDKEPDKVGDAKIHKKGEPNLPGEVAPRAFLDALDKREAVVAEGDSGRLELARWIASAENPLTTRVMANRIWQYHFGRGLVESSSNFGTQGKRPTHPDLLDWLARTFVERGWSIKEMHRLVMSSETYQMASDWTSMQGGKGAGPQPAGRQEAWKIAEAKDPQNQLYWHYPRRRLEAEPLRDAVLFVSGRLRHGNPGRHPFPEPNEKDEYPYTQHRPFIQDYSHEYRSVYLPSRRLGKHPYMETFNGANPNECTERREVSTVPLQSLFWMNSDFIARNAQAMAARLMRETGDVEGRVRSAFRLAYGREPVAEELQELRVYVAGYEEKAKETESDGDPEELAWASFCRLLFASNEFVYLE